MQRINLNDDNTTSLVLECSNQQASIGLYYKHNFFIKGINKADKQSLHLIPEIASLLNVHNLNISDILKIIVGLGPGSFMGTRLGVTIAKSFAFDDKQKLHGVPSLYAVAWKHYQKHQDTQSFIFYQKAYANKFFVKKFEGIDSFREDPNTSIQIMHQTELNEYIGSLGMQSLNSSELYKESPDALDIFSYFSDSKEHKLAILEDIEPIYLTSPVG